jgi:hypothetical protein
MPSIPEPRERECLPGFRTDLPTRKRVVVHLVRYQPDLPEILSYLVMPLPYHKCHCCTAATAPPPHRNCPNVDCNRLFLVCPDCVTRLGGDKRKPGFWP